MVERRPLVLIHLFALLLLMALTSYLPTTTTTSHPHHHSKKKKSGNKKQPPPPTKSSSWEQLKNLLSCRSTTTPSKVHDPAAPQPPHKPRPAAVCGASICALRDVVHGSTRVVHRSDSADHASMADTDCVAGGSGHKTVRAAAAGHQTVPVSMSCSYLRGGMPLRSLSGCYECHAISVEPASRRYPRPRTLCASCPDCGEVFTKPESLELHRAVRHAVSELGPEDSGRNIVEIIFKSSWQKKDRPICQIDRILKVHNTPRTLARFEDYRAAVKSRALLHSVTGASGAGAALRYHQHHQGAGKKNPRCAADGNELLRFHSAPLACHLGARGSTSLCSASTGACSVCSIIRHGFARDARGDGNGVRTTASSGQAHDCAPPPPAPAESGGAGPVRRAMLVCRVIAGRIGGAAADDEEGYDSVAEGDHGIDGMIEGGSPANLEEFVVANPRAILPCFVVIYRVVE